MKTSTKLGEMFNCTSGYLAVSRPLSVYLIIFVVSIDKTYLQCLCVSNYTVLIFSSKLQCYIRKQEKKWKKREITPEGRDETS